MKCRFNIMKMMSDTRENIFDSILLRMESMDRGEYFDPLPGKVFLKCRPQLEKLYDGYQ